MRSSKSCAWCGIPYFRHPKFGKAQWAKSLYCGQLCTGLAYSKKLEEGRPALVDKFNDLFDRGDGCWEWKGTIEGYGYGVIDHNMKRYRAHVLALEFDGRPVPKGMMACHHCDNPPCVRPSHLYAGTGQENADDAVARNRLRIGSAHGMAKLTEDQVTAMRQIEGVSYAEIGRMFNISRPTATKIMKHQLWRHVP